MPQRPFRAVGNESPAAQSDFKQTFFAKCLNRFAHGYAADSELLGEVPLRRQLVTHFQISGDDSPFDLGHNALVETLGTYRQVQFSSPAVGWQVDPNSISRQYGLSRWRYSYTTQMQRQ